MAQVNDKPLTMVEFLSVVQECKTGAREELLDRGFHPNVIYAKAMKAAHKQYTDYGVVADRPWLTPEGEKFLEANR